MMGAQWRYVTGVRRIERAGRKRYAVCIEEVDGNPDRMGRYLVQRLGNELAKHKQIARAQRQKTGRTWGYFDRERMEPYFQIATEAARAADSLEDLVAGLDLAPGEELTLDDIAKLVFLPRPLKHVDQLRLVAALTNQKWERRHARRGNVYRPNR